jgi:uncharacterized protein YjbI with pentapeptide repeats
MTGATFGGKLDADALQVGAILLMRSEGQNTASFKEVVLRGAKITGEIDMTGASFGGKLDAAALQVGGDLYMGSEDQNKTNFRDVDLSSAKVTGEIDMRGARQSTANRSLKRDSLLTGKRTGNFRYYGATATRSESGPHLNSVHDQQPCNFRTSPQTR